MKWQQAPQFELPKTVRVHKFFLIKFIDIEFIALYRGPRFSIE